MCGSFILIIYKNYIDYGIYDYDIGMCVFICIANFKGRYIGYIIYTKQHLAP